MHPGASARSTSAAARRPSRTREVMTLLPRSMLARSDRERGRRGESSEWERTDLLLEREEVADVPGLDDLPAAPERPAHDGQLAPVAIPRRDLGRETADRRDRPVARGFALEDIVDGDGELGERTEERVPERPERGRAAERTGQAVRDSVRREQV